MVCLREKNVQLLYSHTLLADVQYQENEHMRTLLFLQGPIWFVCMMPDLYYCFHVMMK